MTQRKTLGSFEPVDLPDFNVQQVVAKVDTGAFSGAIHCTDIKVIRRGVLRKKILSFNILGQNDRPCEVESYIRKNVRSSTGHRVRRYLIKTTIIIRGESYPIEIGLSDRSDMKKQILIGRRFLREQNMLVDVRMNENYDNEGEMTV